MEDAWWACCAGRSMPVAVSSSVAPDVTSVICRLEGVSVSLAPSSSDADDSEEMELPLLCWLPRPLARPCDPADEDLPWPPPLEVEARWRGRVVPRARWVDAPQFGEFPAVFDFLIMPLP